MPSPLFNALFLIALLVPLAMYLTGLMILAVSLVVQHWAHKHDQSGDRVLAAVH